MNNSICSRGALKQGVLLSILILMSGLCVAQETSPRYYTFAVVPQFSVTRIYSIWQPVLDELENRTGLHFALRNYPSIPAFEQGFADGDYDFAYMNPYHAVVANEEQGYVPLIKDDGRKLHGIFVVGKNSPIQTPKDLDGKVIAYPAPNALGASLLIKERLTDEYAVNTRPSYVKTHTSVYLNVALGRVAGGGGVQKTLDQQNPELRNELRVLFKTREVEPHPIVVHPRISEAERMKVSQALLAMGNEQRTLELLAKIPIRQPGEATLKDYQNLKGLRLERFTH